MRRVNTSNAEFEEMADGVYLAEFPTGENASMKYWRIEPGATLPPHRHEHEQLGFLVDGQLTAIVEGEEYPLRPGDGYFFPSQERHGAENRSDEPAVGIGVLSPPRHTPDWKEK